MSEEEDLKAARKKASQIGVLLGGIALCIGAIACLIYLLIAKPWKFPGQFNHGATQNEPTKPESPAGTNSN